MLVRREGVRPPPPPPTMNLRSSSEIFQRKNLGSSSRRSNGISRDRSHRFSFSSIRESKVSTWMEKEKRWKITRRQAERGWRQIESRTRRDRLRERRHVSNGENHDATWARNTYYPRTMRLRLLALVRQDVSLDRISTRIDVEPSLPHRTLLPLSFLILFYFLPSSIYIPFYLRSTCVEFL